MSSSSSLSLHSNCPSSKNVCSHGASAIVEWSAFRVSTPKWRGLQLFLDVEHLPYGFPHSSSLGVNRSGHTMLLSHRRNSTSKVRSFNSQLRGLKIVVALAAQQLSSYRFISSAPAAASLPILRARSASAQTGACLRLSADHSRSQLSSFRRWGN